MKPNDAIRAVELVRWLRSELSALRSVQSTQTPEALCWDMEIGSVHGEAFLRAVRDAATIYHDARIADLRYRVADLGIEITDQDIASGLSDLVDGRRTHAKPQSTEEPATATTN